MNQSERRLFLIQSLLDERPSCRKQEMPTDAQRQKVLLRGLMNIRSPRAIHPEFQKYRMPICRQKPPKRALRILRTSPPSSRGCIFGREISPH